MRIVNLHHHHLLLVGLIILLFVEVFYESAKVAQSVLNFRTRKGLKHLGHQTQEAMVEVITYHNRQECNPEVR
jgi:hypothetical protein